MEDEHTLPRLAFQEIAHRVVYRDLPLFAALRSGDRDISCQQIDLIPAETQDLTAPHARVQRELHNVRGDRVAAQEQHPDLLVREDPLRQHLLPEEPYSLHGVLLHLAPRDRQVEDAPQARELAIDRGHRDISWVPVGILPTTEYLITPVRLVLLHKLRRDVVKRPILEEGVEAFHKIAVALPGELRGLRVLHILIGQFPEPDRFSSRSNDICPGGFPPSGRPTPAPPFSCSGRPSSSLYSPGNSNQSTRCSFSYRLPCLLSIGMRVDFMRASYRLDCLTSHLVVPLLSHYYGTIMAHCQLEYSGIIMLRWCVNRSMRWAN